MYGGLEGGFAAASAGRRDNVFKVGGLMVGSELTGRKKYIQGYSSSYIEPKSCLCLLGKVLVGGNPHRASLTGLFLTYCFNQDI